MRVNRSVEHAMHAILMIAVQAGGEPVKSHVLSGVMGVSDSYLKKTMRKLVAAGKVSAAFEGSYAAFLGELDACPLSTLLEDEATRGEIDWNLRR